MIVVLDASAAVELVLHRSHAATLQNVLRDADSVIAPDLYVSEVANALWKHAQITGNELDMRIIDDAVAVPDDFVAAQTLYREAFALGSRSKHPVCDCMYLVAARRNNAVLVTLDRRMMRLATSEGVQTLTQ